MPMCRFCGLEIEEYVWHLDPDTVQTRFECPVHGVLGVRTETLRPKDEK